MKKYDTTFEDKYSAVGKKNSGEMRGRVWFGGKFHPAPFS